MAMDGVFILVVCIACLLLIALIYVITVAPGL